MHFHSIKSHLNSVALRSYSRVDAQAVRAFVAETDLHPLSAREALKWLERKGL